ncbi:aminodeoxychorismate synthase component I [Shewanella sp. 1_MG-2023]|uniref:aminodeoxychorismate synthase component I n=1 Tax=unclassified Shewanella TaxID=196818 RepID=UPI0026E22688|nr:MULTISPECIES: aminodeoxychorismate synthase component I [unclassified Shewanella]MDO6612396.1 aminodeoxychorismate synthase component I [Shewanella sp. 7_MG-2023]MDO6772250.1 aminodeoxychorismate synthase component I [Shewanella sp. 2_MG-2023]MDO6794156.1 aminodeoxychorismate synthase component I [Shewanella sp. 1_MG-2023]
MGQLSQDSLAITKLNWALDTHTVFSVVSDQPWAMLLDSTQTLHQDANFDIIVFSPIATLVSDGSSIDCSIVPTRQTQSDINSSATITPTATANVFETLQAMQSKLYPSRFDCKLPFSGGSVGSFNYDLGRVIENLPQQAMKDIQLPDVNVGFYDFSLLFSHQEKCWYATHYLGEQALKLEVKKFESKLNKVKLNEAKLNVAKLDEAQNTSKQSHPNNVFKLTSTWQNQTTKAQYQQRFEQVQTYLHQGDCYQINLTQRFNASYEGCEWQAYCALSDANKAPFSGFIRLKDHCILSISPERFIQLTDDKVSTKPIKGTLPRGKTPQEDNANAVKLKASEKDRAENVMIVDLLRNDISKVATAGSVNVPKLFDIESFPAVHHLVSTVEATLAPQYDAVDLLKAAFPGGSITGAPKIRAMEIIEELEPSRRNIYCGSIGYISQDGHMDTSITIRTLVTENNSIYCWAGGGIVADSDVDAEYQETFDKVSKILPVLEQVNQ